MSTYPKRKIIFLISGMAILTILAGCTISPNSSTASTFNMALEVKSLPPVFSNMNQLRSQYHKTLYSTGNLNFVVSSLPTMVAEFSELDLNTSLPFMPEKLTAYKIIRPTVDEIYTKNLGQNLGFNGIPQFIDTDDAYRIFTGSPSDDNSPFLSVYKDGSIWVSYTRNKYSQPLSLPSDQECISIAREWLNTHNLYPQNVIDVQTSPSVISIMSGRTESHYTYATHVSFLTGLDGYELFGMGAYFLIGEGGKILEVNINAPEFEPYSYVEVEQPETAMNIFQEYLQDSTKFRADTPECLISFLNSYISVNSVSIKYFGMLSLDATQIAYAQPVYIIDGEGKENLDSPSWNHFIGAVDAVQR